jgi:hypothetical protein
MQPHNTKHYHHTKHHHHSQEALVLLTQHHHRVERETEAATALPAERKARWFSPLHPLRLHTLLSITLNFKKIISHDDSLLWFFNNFKTMSIRITPPMVPMIPPVRVVSRWWWFSCWKRCLWISLLRTSLTSIKPAISSYLGLIILFLMPLMLIYIIEAIQI